MNKLLFITILERIASSFEKKKNKYCLNYRLLQENNYPDCIIKLSNESRIKIKSNLEESKESLHLTNSKRKTYRVIFPKSIKDTDVNYALSDMTSVKISSTEDPKNEFCL
ncbi:hypothetical protein NBO_66g0002 [Nosema bombycis CQ1]|uniref:Uncharacterized protein n=1 Tax=Nosema bombycis (strain CQ1 / CVCC 102059) TaxID=578461 RepID=R0KTI7_NOSB1|nr:hypothetical protein NBO_66g0002 [Nosema bombycis CQ1]|eukprot:EOB13542.1 hypothetical protein NBO_66g0002 [Nosema bombycis CQ1]